MPPRPNYSRKGPAICGRHRGTVSAFGLRIVKFVRSLVPALALIAAIVSAASAPLLAAPHEACAAQQHHCGADARVASCCCGHDDSGDHDGTPAQSRVEAQADLAAIPVAIGDVVVAASPRPLLRVHTSPPYLTLRDLPTLFATLLI